MEYDSESSCEDRLKDFEISEQHQHLRQSQQNAQCVHNSNLQPCCKQQVSTQAEIKLGAPNRSLSSQVMEYYHKYSQNTNLDQYFSLPTSSTSPEYIRNYYSIYELYPKLDIVRQDCIGEEYSLKSYVPRERRRWVRPALIGQSSNTDTSTSYVQPLINPRSPSPDLKQTNPETIAEEKNESQETLPETGERKLSPTSSTASHKPLEWDSGADVGYFNTLPHNKKNSKKWSTIERMALARGCSAALRLDPEGTTESGLSGKMTTQKPRRNHIKSTMIPNANSTSLAENNSESESELEITPIVGNQLSDIITGSQIQSTEKQKKSTCAATYKYEHYSQILKDQSTEAPKSTSTVRMFPVKYPVEVVRITNKPHLVKESSNTPSSPLKKSTSMNTLPAAASKMLLKRSQSDLNLLVKEQNKGVLPLIFNSTSSIATIVNKPTTCDKFIQTSLSSCMQESVGVQVSVIQEEKPPVPKRGTSLQKTLHSILKNSEGTYKVRKVQNASTDVETSDIDGSQQAKMNKARCQGSEASENDSSATPQPGRTKDITGRANSFEYFPGHIYENVPNGSDSHVSSVDTGRSNSTLPNTSSSINEKLWGDSDSLVRDLERSVNILKTLVDANKCDKHVKKRLIHHVVKRLITAKYTDDKIEHNLEDNVPWNPDDARKLYRTEILPALTKTDSTTDSSDDWKHPKKIDGVQNPTGIERNILKNVVLESSNSDKFDRHINRTEMDGRKARIGLRTDHCQQNNNVPTDQDKSESSECFFPQRTHKGNKVKKSFCMKEKCKLLQDESTTTNSSPPDQNRLILDAVVNSRRLSAESSNNTDNNADWRLPTTLSERQYELKKCGNSEGGDTKLVSYAEMEKRNQLIWITNEISHLSNLKKLLEQPRKLERPRSSPRKAKLPTFEEKPTMIHEYMRGHSGNTDYNPRNMAHMQKVTLNEQWSSHCNLASRESSSNEVVPTVHRVRKRNSCSQTATDAAGAHSRTGREIVSASILRTPPINLMNVGVQASLDTLPFSTAAQSQFDHWIKCPLHKTIMHIQNSCTRREESCECQQHSVHNLRFHYVCKHCSQGKTWSVIDHCHKSVENADYKQGATVNTRQEKSNSIGTNTDFTNLHTNGEVNQVKQKEAKNQINASKSRYICDCCNARSCQFKITQKGTEEKTVSEKRALSGVCQLCVDQIPVVKNSNECRYKKETCTCGKVYEHNAEPLRKEGRESVFKRKTQYYQHNDDNLTHALNCVNAEVTKICECPNECSCENSREKQRDTVFDTTCLRDCCSNVKNQHKERHHECHSKNGGFSLQVKPYYLPSAQENTSSQQSKVQISPKCSCNAECSCAKKYANSQFDNTNRESVKSNCENMSDVNNSDRNYNKFCGVCGIIYQNAKKCSCRQPFPKAIAYELSFADKNNQKSDVSSVNLLPKVPLLNVAASNNGKSEGCNCEVTNKNYANKVSSEKHTLQDYLSENKPDFVGNAETRRQYMYEISHLRQLRKEKRMQLLAMASTSKMIKSPKSSKPAVCVQKRITDAEMRERLRKRYLRLNEVRLKRQMRERQEEVRRNKLMANIFGKKLQQKVLRGQINLSRSVSVMSNL